MQQSADSSLHAVLITLLYLIAPVKSCLPWGCFGVSCYAIQPPCLFGICLPGIAQPPYMGCPCRTGMSCIAGACVAVAHAAKTFRETEGETSASALKNPNDQFLTCCRSMAVPELCHPLCSFEGYTKQAIQNSISFLPNSCPVTSLSTVHFCASRGIDHTQCCKESGVSPDCLIFCNQRQNNTNALLSLSHLQCLSKFDDLKASLTVRFYN
ncbi:hypothetical protein WR25_20200 [Diploscapter pachys]|uniref:Domain of unknown function DB domain-containing protein n=1 Tax=Diploscapter pachys TaxID=2018661 RepID=A0A2A2JTM0_9BILA|nr:hypothetical protein WR25_20200 [Diploscapter pachys]